jgi:hypothetical protein
MQHDANHNPSPDGTASLLVAALEHAWQTIRTRHPDVPEAVLVVASGGEGKRLNLGHFAPPPLAGQRQRPSRGAGRRRRSPARPHRGSGDAAARGRPRPGQARGVQDTSRQGRYHNRRYAQLAGELGLEVASVKPIGWSATTVPEYTASTYAAQLEGLQAALVLWRRQEHRIGSGTRARNLLAAACGCGRRIRVAKAILAEAPIVCGACHNPSNQQNQTKERVDA